MSEAKTVALPLQGKRILVTRASAQAAALSERLSALGAIPVVFPVIRIAPPPDWGALDAALAHLYAISERQPYYTWLIFTSANAVRAMAHRAAALSLSFAGGARPKVAAIGETTANAARNVGFPVSLVPPSYVAEALVESIENLAAGKKILLARGEIARDVIPNALCAAGASVDVVDAYRNVLPESAPALLRAALEKGIDAATFTSSSSATHLAEAARAAGIAFPFAGVLAISIGPITSATLRERGWEPAAEATRADVASLIEAVGLALS